LRYIFFAVIIYLFPFSFFFAHCLAAEKEANETFKKQLQDEKELRLLSPPMMKPKEENLDGGFHVGMCFSVFTFFSLLFIVSLHSFFSFFSACLLCIFSLRGAEMKRGGASRGIPRGGPVKSLEKQAYRVASSSDGLSAKPKPKQQQNNNSMMDMGDIFKSIAMGNFNLKRAVDQSDASSRMNASRINGAAYTNVLKKRSAMVESQVFIDMKTNFIIILGVNPILFSFFFGKLPSLFLDAIYASWN
jgi:hypothetical protein